MYRFLLRPRWVTFTLLVALAVPVCVRLGQWQLDRYQERHAANQLRDRNLAAEPVPINRLAGPDRPVAEGAQFRRVSLSGTYDRAGELLVRNRAYRGRTGFFVVTPLVVGGSGADTTAVLVNRGWVPRGATASERPEVAAPPAGTVAVAGRIRSLETTESTGIRQPSELPDGQAALISAETVGARVPHQLYAAYVELVDQEPATASAPEPVPVPRAALEGQNLAYVVQWNLFALLAIVTWVLLVRREVRERRKAPGGSPPDPTERSERWPAASRTTP